MRLRAGFVLICCALLLASCAQEGAEATPPVNGGGLAPATRAPAQPTVTAKAPEPGTATPDATASVAASSTSMGEPPATATAAQTVDEGLLFSGERSFVQLEVQMAFGPRWPGSPGHAAVGDYIAGQLEESGWEVEEQLFEYQGVAGRNIVGRANVGVGPVVIVGAHYDTRRIADETPGGLENELPVPGAVDGASGVAVLLELARTLDLATTPREVWLAFFDMEDNGNGGIDGWDWIVGSTYMAENLTVTPEAMVLVDLVGDADQQLYYEGNSDPALRETLWTIAGELGYGDAFIPELRYTMIDDHVPFARRGIAAVDIIDFDYPYWHTVEDTADKASAESLERVGRTLEVWLEQVIE